MNLKFEKYANGLIPAIVQDAAGGCVLMLGFMNAEAVAETERTGRVTFYSRSKNRLWTKGETSGNYLKVVSINPDCDLDTILIKAHASGPVCHTGLETCFGQKPTQPQNFLQALEEIIQHRRSEPPENSYVARLFAGGINKIVQKVGEEAVEVVIAAKDNDDVEFRNEAADLLFHLLVLLNAKGTSLDQIGEVLKERHMNII